MYISEDKQKCILFIIAAAIFLIFTAGLAAVPGAGVSGAPVVIQPI
ncbi:hypothetical protein [Acetivibrio cellulolyticus]|nr:hypothetical protein [Acetivibrio cellulolyticus]